MNTKDLVRVRHIVDYLYEGLTFSEGETRDSLEENLLLTRALCGYAVMIGTTISRISDECKQSNPQIPWDDALPLRDYLTNYSRFSYDELWADITHKFPSLLAEFERLT